MSPAPLAIAVHGVRKRFGAREALAGVTLEVPAGSCLALFGRNGAGKSTLVRILATLAHATEGRVAVLGHALPAGGVLLRRRLGVVQDHALLPRHQSLLDGLLWHAALFGVAHARARIEALAERFGLRSRLRDPVRTFSRGMTQRASLMRALVHEPELLLLDEPFTGLDPEGCGVVEAVVREQVAAGRTVLLVTHDLQRGCALAPRAVLLEQGRVLGDGDSATLARRLGGAA
jgi:ABC-type multidrug transport system ATPase subunit